MCKFNDAVTAYRFSPTVANLIALTDSALPLLQAPRVPNVAARSRWQNVADVCAFNTAFTRLKITIDRRLSDGEVDNAAGCVGYALKEALAGETLIVTNIMRSYDAQQTVLICEYDSSVSLRSCPDVAFALHLAAKYVKEGSPLRVSNRSGAGTAGTRLVDGIGAADVQFAVR